MADKMRDPHETKDMGVKRLISQHEKWNKTVCSPEKKREFEKKFEREILPKIYDKGLK